MALKPRKVIKVESVRVITRADLPRLVQKRNYVTQVPQKLREGHHWIARMLSLGCSLAEVSVATGYSYSRISILANSPAMKELIAKLQKENDKSWQSLVNDYQAVLAGNMMQAELMVRDRLQEADEAGELLPIRDLMSISRDAADRLGHGKKTTNVNINVDLAARMEKMRQREAKVVEATAVPVVKTSGNQTPVLIPSKTAPAERPAQPSSNSIRRV